MRPDVRAVAAYDKWLVPAEKNPSILRNSTDDSPLHLRHPLLPTIEQHLGTESLPLGGQGVLLPFAKTFWPLPPAAIGLRFGNCAEERK